MVFEDDTWSRAKQWASLPGQDFLCFYITIFVYGLRHMGLILYGLSQLKQTKTKFDCLSSKTIQSLTLSSLISCETILIEREERLHVIDNKLSN